MNENTPLRILRLSQINFPQYHEGDVPCACCDQPAVSWHRTEMAAGGLVRAAVACKDHGHLMDQLLQNLTIEDCVRLMTPQHRVQCLPSLERQAAKLEDRAATLARQEASLQGESSVLYAIRLTIRESQRRAKAMRQLAEALRQAISSHPQQKAP